MSFRARMLRTRLRHAKKSEARAASWVFSHDEFRQAEALMRFGFPVLVATFLPQRFDRTIVTGHFQIADAGDGRPALASSYDDGAFPISRSDPCRGCQLLGGQRRRAFHYNVEPWHGDPPA